MKMLYPKGLFFFVALYFCNICGKKIMVLTNSQRETRNLENAGELHSIDETQSNKKVEHSLLAENGKEKNRGTQTSLSMDIVTEYNYSLSHKNSNSKSTYDTDDYDHDIEEEEILDTFNYLFLKLQNSEKNILNDLKENKGNKTCRKVLQKFNLTRISSIHITNKLIVKLKQLWKKQDNLTHDSILLVLSCLEDLVQDFRNSKRFNVLHCVSDVLLPMLNCSEYEFQAKSGKSPPTLYCSPPALQVEAAHLLASALHINPRIQISALNHGAMPILLRAIMLDLHPMVRFYSVYALSYLIRNYPEAQALFVRVGGLDILSQLFKEEKKNYKTMIRIITMLHDLLKKHKDTVKSYPGLDLRMHSIYRAVGLEKKLLEQGWCAKILHTLLTQVPNGNLSFERENVTSAVEDSPEIIPNDLKDEYDVNLPLLEICHKDYGIKMLKQDKWFYFLL